MSGGNRHEIYNYRERIISNDFNREQQFIARDRAELLRHQCSDIPAGTHETGAARNFTSLPSVIDAPLRADVYEGLEVMPVVGSWSLLVIPGVVGMHDPDGEAGASDPTHPPSPDDSPYKLLYDDGISASGVLAITPNLAAFTRIDTIECQRSEVVSESENRDIYNPATRLFTPALKDKVSKGTLAYRVRLGVPGAGMPAPVQGWLPLAIARVPITATSTDDVTFWDVRPVVRDRPFQPYRDFSGTNAFKLGHNLGHSDPFSTGGMTKLAMMADGEAYPGVIGGGRLYRGVPGADTYIDAQAADNREPGFALGAHQIWYLWHVFPYGLPRWVKYITAPITGTTRRPFGPQGIPVLSTKAPVNLSHGIMNPGTPITVPVSTDLAAVCTVGTCVGAFGSTGAGVPGAAIVDGDWTWLGNDCTIHSIAPSAGAGSLVSNTWTLTAGTHFPLNARALRIQVMCGLVGVADKGATYAIRVFVRRNGAVDEVASNVYAEFGGVALGDTGTIAFLRQFEIPRIPPNLVTLTTDLEFTVEWNFVSAGLAKAAESASVVGWRLSQ